MHGRMQPKSRLCLLAVVLLTRAWAAEGTLTAYWNVPLDKCSRLGVNFDLDQFNIVHNAGNVFKGDKVNILYQPGEFPHYSPTGAPVNGGIPQRGNLTLHVAAFKQQLQFLPSNYTGLLVLDFELYMPSFSVSLPRVYQDQSVQWVRHQHPNWTHEAVLREAQRTFNASAKPFFEVLLQEAVRQHPGSLVGFYHYPYCEDYKPPFLHCAPQLRELNDGLRGWLLDASRALYSSVYLQRRFSADRQWRVVRAKLLETQRLRKKNVPVLPYMWYRYGDTEELVNRAALLRLLWLLRTCGADGIVVWGAAHNLANRTSCLEFKDYLYDTLGPVLKCFHKMAEEDAREIQRRFSAISRHWLSSSEINPRDYYDYFHIQNPTEEMRYDFFNYNQRIHLRGYLDSFPDNQWPLNRLSLKNHGLERETFHKGRTSKDIDFTEGNKGLTNTKISPYPSSSELSLLTAILKNYCAL